MRRLTRSDSARDLHGLPTPQRDTKCQAVKTDPRAAAPTSRFKLAPAPSAGDGWTSTQSGAAAVLRLDVRLPPVEVGKQERLRAQMQKLAHVGPARGGREAGLQLPQLGDELALLHAIDDNILPAFEALPRAGQEATCAATLMDSRDELTELFVSRAYDELATRAEGLSALAVSVDTDLAARTLRLELLLLTRRRRAQLNLAQRGAASAASAASAAQERGPAQLGRRSLDALEGRLVALLVRPL